MNFCDPFGFLQQISVHSDEITEEAFRNGIPRLDGISIKGFKEIEESDMILKPDPSTFAILPNYFDKDYHNKDNTYTSRGGRMFVDIYEGFNGTRYTREFLGLSLRRLIKLQRKRCSRKPIGALN